MSDQTPDKPGSPGGPGSPDSIDKMPENVPAPTGEVGQVGVRQGMFGVSGTGDTSGYGGLVSAVTFPAPAQRPFGGWFDEVADALEAATRSAGVEQAVGSVVVHRGEITFHVRREDLLTVARVLRDDEALRHCERALALETSFEGLKLLGQIAERGGDRRRARHAWRLALATGGDPPQRALVQALLLGVEPA